jgi:F-type H+/Na+-transporting ATPase subunit alpha
VFAAVNGYLDSVDVERLRMYEEELYRFLETQRPAVLTAIAEKKILDDEVKPQLAAALDEFGKQFAASA